MSNEAKVGAFSVAGICMLIAIVLYLSGFNPTGSNDYKFDIIFKQVTGLKPGAAVSYAGITAGRVTAIEAYQDKAKVTVEIKGDMKIADDSVFTISSDGLMGEKFISIMPPEHPEGGYVAAGSVVQGLEEKGLDYLFAQAGTTMADLQELIKSMNAVLGNKDVQDSMIQTAVNMKNLTANLNEMMAVMANLAVNNQQELDSTVKNLSAMMASMADAADRVDTMIADFAGDGQTAADMREAIANLKSASESAKVMAQNMQQFATPETAEHLNNIIRNADNISSRADSAMERISDIEIKTGVDALYSGGESDWMVNADMRIYTDPNSFLLLGADDIGGDDSGTNLQIGTGNGSFTGRGGLIDDKVGLGVDVQAGDRAKFSVDAYDPDDLRIKLRGQYELSDGTYLLGQIKDVNDSDDRAAYLGIRQEF